MDIRKAQATILSARPATASNTLWRSLHLWGAAPIGIWFCSIFSFEVAVQLRDWANMFAFFTECGTKLAISLIRTKKIENYLGCKDKKAFLECHLHLELSKKRPALLGETQTTLHSSCLGLNAMIVNNLYPDECLMRLSGTRQGLIIWFADYYKQIWWVTSGSRFGNKHEALPK